MYSIPYVICGQSGLAHDSISLFHPIAILAEGGSHDPKKDREVDLGPQRAPGDESTWHPTQVSGFPKIRDFDQFPASAGVVVLWSWFPSRWGGLVWVLVEFHLEFWRSCHQCIFSYLITLAPQNMLRWCLKNNRGFLSHGQEIYYYTNSGQVVRNDNKTSESTAVTVRDSNNQQLTDALTLGDGPLAPGAQPAVNAEQEAALLSAINEATVEQQPTKPKPKPKPEKTEAAEPKTLEESDTQFLNQILAIAIICKNDWSIYLVHSCSFNSGPVSQCFNMFQLSRAMQNIRPHSGP